MDEMENSSLKRRVVCAPVHRVLSSRSSPSSCPSPEVQLPTSLTPASAATSTAGPAGRCDAFASSPDGAGGAPARRPRRCQRHRAEDDAEYLNPGVSTAGVVIDEPPVIPHLFPPAAALPQTTPRRLQNCTCASPSASAGGSRRSLCELISRVAAEPRVARARERRSVVRSSTSCVPGRCTRSFARRPTRTRLTCSDLGKPNRGRTRRSVPRARTRSCAA